MFTIKANYIGNQQPVKDSVVVINGQKCKCNQSIVENISPIVKRFYKNKKNKDLNFETKIPYRQNISIAALNLANPLSSICAMISKLFCGEEIICQKDNTAILLLIGQHFKIQEIINKIESYQKYHEEISSHLKNSEDIQQMIKLEKFLLFEINETNLETKINEFKSFFEKIPIICLIHFVLNICIKKYKINKVNTNEFLIGIIKNINKIVPGTFVNFISIMIHKFIIINSNFVNSIDKYNKKEINSLIHQIFVDGLLKDFNENIKIIQIQITIPKYMEKYFIKNGIFWELSKENNIINQSKETYSQFDSIINFINNDDIDSFQNCIISSQLDINIKIKNDIADRVSFVYWDEGCSLIELSAFFGSIKCFSFLYNKQAKINKGRICNFAIAGGNTEIIHICEREECVFNEKSLDISIEYHEHQITKWLVETKNIHINEKCLKNCIINYNIIALKYLLKKGINMSKMIIYICESNNSILFKLLTLLLKNYNMDEMIYQENQKTALHIACEQNNIDIVKILLSDENIDINSISEVIILSNIIYYIFFNIS